jgi:uncharacterized membrane protein
MSEETFWTAVQYLHLLAMAFFVGGQLVVAAAVVPVERRFADRDRLRAIARRFGYGSLIALVVLVATGVAMATEYRFWSLDTLQVKLALVGVVIALTALHLVWPRLRVLQAVILLASLTIVWLGVDLAH